MSSARLLPDLLARIVARRRERLGLAPGAFELPAAEPSTPLADPAAHPFLAALTQRRGRAVIAEVKLGSPRLASLADRVDPTAQARRYAEGGAAALSVVVEPDFFYGSYELLTACREASGLPAIAKEFVVDARQLEWAKAAGADAILLIAALYRPPELLRFAAAARRLGLVPLVETHGFDDLRRLGGQRWELVGVNNRDLRSFEVDLNQSLALLPSLPAGAVRVSESGIATAADVARLRAAGYDAFLIGESLLLADDPSAKLAELVA